MPLVVIPANQITDWSSFHDVFSEKLGFPDFYGRNMDAWIDCLDAADDSASGLLAEHIYTGNGDFLTLQIDSIQGFADRCPEIYAALIECSAFVNWRRIEAGERPILALSFWK